MTPAERGEEPCGIRPGCCSTHDAAPELAEALEVVSALLDSIVPAGDELDEPIEKALENARAALRKAGKVT